MPCRVFVAATDKLWSSKTFTLDQKPRIGDRFERQVIDKHLHHRTALIEIIRVSRDGDHRAQVVEFLD